MKTIQKHTERNNIVNIEKLIQEAFTGIVGQHRLVTRCTQAALSYARGGDLTSTLFEGQAGLGKTKLWAAYMDALNVAFAFRTKREPGTLDYSRRYSSPSEFRLMGEEYGQLENAIQNMETLFLGIDEMSDFKDSPTVQTKRVYNFIKKTLDGNGFAKDGTKEIKWDSETSLTVGRSTHAFICATNFPEKMPDAEAMRSRFTRMVLDVYSEEELTDILLLMLKGKSINANENTVGLIAKCGRGTARPLEKIVSHLETMIIATEKRTRSINREDALQAMQLLQLYPSGLEAHEVLMLIECTGQGHRQPALALMTNKEVKAVSRSIAFLQSRKLAYTQGSRVVTSPKGMRYLEAIKGDKFTLPNAI